MIRIVIFLMVLFKASQNDGKHIGDLTNTTHDFFTIETTVTDDRYLLANVEMPYDGIVKEFEFYVIKPGRIFIQFVKIKNCTFLSSQTCSEFLAKNYQTLNIKNDLELTFIPSYQFFNLGLQKLSLVSNQFVTKGMSIYLDQYYGGSLAADKSGSAPYSDYVIDSKMSSLKRIDREKNYKFYFSATLIPFIPDENTMKYIGKPIPDNIQSGSSTMASIFLDYILLATRFEQDSFITGVELVLNEIPLISRIGQPIDIFYLEFDLCKADPSIIDCIEYVRNYSQLINFTITSSYLNNIKLTNLENGYNNINFSKPFFVPRGSYLIVKDNALAIAVNKNVTASEVTNYQVNLTENSTTKLRDSPCYLTKPNWNYYIRVAYQPNLKTEIKIGSLPDSKMSNFTGVAVEYFILTSIEFKQDSSINGYEFYATSAGFVNIGTVKHVNCEEYCADFFLKLENLDNPGVQILNEKWIETKEGYNNFTFYEMPIFVSKGSLIILRQNNTGKIAVDRSGNAVQSDVLVNCVPKCLTAHKLNAYSNWRFSMKVNYNSFISNIFYGQEIPSTIDERLIVTNNKKASYSYTPGVGFFLLNNVIIKENSYVDKIEFYAANPGSISVGFINLHDHVLLDQMTNFSYEAYWYNGLGYLPDFIIPKFFDAKTGLNSYYFDQPFFYKKNTVLYLQQTNALVAIDTSGKANKSDLVVEGPTFYSTFPPTKFIYNVTKLNPIVNWRFYLRIRVKQIDYSDSNDEEFFLNTTQTYTSTTKNETFSSTIFQMLIGYLLNLLRKILNYLF